MYWLDIGFHVTSPFVQRSSAHLFRRSVRIVNCPYCKIEVSQLKLPEHIARRGGGKKTGDVELRNPRNMCDLWMIYG